jgi:hypothetical protein
MLENRNDKLTLRFVKSLDRWQKDSEDKTRNPLI